MGKRLEIGGFYRQGRRYFEGTGMKQWYLYIIRCDDRYFYTGISTDVQRRVAEHISGNQKAAKYTKSFSSIALVYEVLVGDRSMAAKIEYRIKKLPKRDKELIVSGRFGRDELIRYIGLSPAASSA
jgi:putative endonuclease